VRFVTRGSPYRVLFLCTGNSARSILAEALLRARGGDRFAAYSAGSRPAGAVNPHALKFLRDHRLPADGIRSKSWEEFAVAGAPAMDFVITVCDQTAGEVCPVWPGQPMTAHWGIPDPAAVTGSDEVKRKAFADAAHLLNRRIELFTSLPIDKLDRLALQSQVRGIGRNA